MPAARRLLLRPFRPLIRPPLSPQQSTAFSRHTRILQARSVSTAAQSAELPPSKPSLLRRAFSYTTRAFSYTTRALLFTTLGFVIAMAPAYSALDDVIHPIDDAKSLTIFTPPDEDSADKEAYINSLPLVLSLRSDPAFSESRPHMKIPSAWRAHNFTGGTLLGPGRVTVPPLAFADKEGKNFYQIFHVGTDLCGHQGIVHGGFLATVLDEGLARCCFAALPHHIGLTAKLEINYKAPAKADQYLVLRATTTRVDGRKAWVDGHIETVPAVEGEEPVVLASATALYISPRGAEKMAKVYPVQ